MSSATMRAAPSEEPPASSHALVSPPEFLVEWQPWGSSFARNLADFFRPQTVDFAGANPGNFWPDVFVNRDLPRRGLAISAIYHAAALAMLYALPTLLLIAARTPPAATPPAKLTFYQVSEYLPPVVPTPAPPKSRHEGEPQLARQSVVSVPRSADNRQQTVVDPNSVKLAELPRPAPNLFIWSQLPALPEAAIPQPRLTLPTAPVQVVMPPPETIPAASRRSLPQLPTPAVIEPEPSVDAVSRPAGEINLARAKVEVVAPTLPVPEQQAVSLTAKAGEVAKTTPAVSPASSPSPAPVTEAPVFAPAGGMGAAQRLIALNLHPAEVSGPVELPEGNRSGEFAATPAGKPESPGTPAANAAGQSETAGTPAVADAPQLPGIMIAPGPNLVASTLPTPLVQAPPAPAATQESRTQGPSKLLASNTPPRLADLGRRPALTAPAGTVADTVFGGKKYYSLSLNMPNLASAGGSWIIRFAELGRVVPPGELTAPVAVDKVDPAYPPQMIQDRVEGIVTLYAVIRSDGSVAEVRVLQGINSLLDENACAALSRWRFRPATRNGAAVDLEAVVQIPFKSRRLPF